MKQMRKLLVIGNSHTRMIKDAVAHYGSPEGIEVECRWLFGASLAKHGDTTMEDAMDLVAALTPHDLLALSIAGTSHHVIGILNHPIPFTLCESPDGPVPVPEGFTVVPMNLMRAYFESGLASSDRFDRFRSASKCPIIFYSPPPPKDSVVLPKKDIYRGQKFSEMGFGPKASRLALWSLEMDVIRRQLKRKGVRTLPVPRKALTAEGYLADAFLAKDMAHANERYGKLILDKLVYRMNHDAGPIVQELT